MRNGTEPRGFTTKMFVGVNAAITLSIVTFEIITNSKKEVDKNKSDHDKIPVFS